MLSRERRVLIGNKTLMELTAETEATELLRNSFILSYAVLLEGS